jgi:hypothetical protein
MREAFPENYARLERDPGFLILRLRKWQGMEPTLRPAAASWSTGPTGSLALLAYDAGAQAAGWDRDDLATPWCPPLDDPVGGSARWPG